MILSTNVLNLSEQSAGRYRCTFNYVLSDGREINIKPASVGADYQAVCEAKAPSVLEDVVKSDADDAMALGVKTAYGYASQAQVFYASLYAGYTNPDPLESYDLMNGVAQPLLGMGLPTIQLAAMLGEEVEMAQAVIDHWHKLDPVVIEAYRSIKDSL